MMDAIRDYAEDAMTDAELDRAACEAVGLEPITIPSEHGYPGISKDGYFEVISSCACDCWMGGTRIGGPEGVDPFGECPENPARLEYLPVSTDPAASAELRKAVRAKGWVINIALWPDGVAQARVLVLVGGGDPPWEESDTESDTECRSVALAVVEAGKS